MASPRLGKIIARLIRGRPPKRGSKNWAVQNQLKPLKFPLQKVREAFVSKARHNLEKYNRILSEHAGLIPKIKIFCFPKKGEPGHNSNLEIELIELNGFADKGEIPERQEIRIGCAKVKLIETESEWETVPIFVHYAPSNQSPEKRDWGEFKVSFGSHKHRMRFSEFVVALNSGIQSVIRHKRHDT